MTEFKRLRQLMHILQVINTGLKISKYSIPEKSNFTIYKGCIIKKMNKLLVTSFEKTAATTVV